MIDNKFDYTFIMCFIDMLFAITSQEVVTTHSST